MVQISLLGTFRREARNESGDIERSREDGNSFLSRLPGSWKGEIRDTQKVSGIETVFLQISRL